MTARAGVWKRRREALQDRRTPLFKRYERSPNDLRLALEIKAIDDQIAECTRQLERENQRAEPGREARLNNGQAACGLGMRDHKNSPV